MNKTNKTFYGKRIHRLELGAIFVLLFVLLFFYMFPKKFEKLHVKNRTVLIDFTVESIPATKQMVRRGKPRPKKPSVPIPAEDLDFPEDATIDDESFKWNFGGSPLGNSGLTASRADTIPPRPILQVMPEYPEQLRKQKIKGSIKLLVRIGNNGAVKDVIVSDNSTGSDICERIAIESAYKSSYMPAKTEKKAIDMWTSCTYSFSPN
jgi:TonB family protein